MDSNRLVASSEAADLSGVKCQSRPATELGGGVLGQHSRLGGDCGGRGGSETDRYREVSSRCVQDPVSGTGPKGTIRAAVTPKVLTSSMTCNILMAIIASRMEILVAGGVMTWPKQEY